MGVSIEIFKVHTFFNMSTTSQAFFFYITLKRTLFYEEWYHFHFSTMICIGTTSVAFFLATLIASSSEIFHNLCEVHDLSFLFQIYYNVNLKMNIFQFFRRDSSLFTNRHCPIIEIYLRFIPHFKTNFTKAFIIPSLRN